MADPVIFACPVNTWVKVATAVVTGFVWIFNKSPNVYRHTYRDTGGAAPSDDSDAVVLPFPGLPISSTTSIDVYIKAVGVVGSVRVDLV